MANDYLQIIEDSRQELMELLDERSEIERRIGQLNKAIRGLAAMLPPDEKEVLLNELLVLSRPAGLTEKITDFLSSNKEAEFTGNEIRDHLENSGFDLSEYSQPLATVFNTLKRLKQSGRVKQKLTTNKERRLVYKWVGK